MNNSITPNYDHNIYKQGIQNFQINKYKEIEKYYLSETIKLSLITGPLYCISANMQFLNLNTNINGTTTNNTVTQVQLKSLPFKPTFQVNYKQCLFNLYRQGILGLYKGNFYRLLFFSSTNKLKTTLDRYLPNFDYPRSKEILLYSLIDILMNPLLVIESRYSIQNRKTGFRIYNNLFEVFSKSWREIYRGSLYSIPRNILFLIGLNFYYLYPSTYFQIISVCVAHILSYPILTIQRNIIFHSQSTLYLPAFDSKITSSSVGKYMIKNVGIPNLYRGFLSYSFATFLWHAYVPSMAKMKFYKNAFEEDNYNNSFKINFLEDDEYEDK